MSWRGRCEKERFFTSDVKQARVLIGAAVRDLNALHGMRDVEVFADEIFGFHAQQAAEKLCKAWIALLGEEYPLPHNLGRLLELLEDRGVATARFGPLIEYTPFASGIRYGDYNLSVTPIDRPDALRRIEELLEQVVRQMPEGEEQ